VEPTATEKTRTTKAAVRATLLPCFQDKTAYLGIAGVNCHSVSIAAMLTVIDRSTCAQPPLVLFYRKIALS
jgi:hypothetical protein